MGHLPWGGGEQHLAPERESCAWSRWPCAGWWGPRGLPQHQAAAELLFPAVVRKLQEFELPYVSVTSLHNSEFRIILRKR